MQEKITIKEVHQFLADDGSKFSTAEACERYEKEMRDDATRRQIPRKTIDLCDDPSRNSPSDSVCLFAIQNVHQWEARTHRPYPPDRPFTPFLTLEYYEEVDDHCGGNHYDAQTMDPQAFADLLTQQAQRVRMAIEQMKPLLALPSDDV